MALEANKVAGFSEEDTEALRLKLFADPTWECMFRDDHGPCYVYANKETGEFQVFGDQTLCRIALRVLKEEYASLDVKPHQGSKEKGKRVRRLAQLRPPLSEKN